MYQHYFTSAYAHVLRKPGECLETSNLIPPLGVLAARDNILPTLLEWRSTIFSYETHSQLTLDKWFSVAHPPLLNAFFVVLCHITFIAHLCTVLSTSWIFVVVFQRELI